MTTLLVSALERKWDARARMRRKGAVAWQSSLIRDGEKADVNGARMDAQVKGA
jgi:hypothetical protein